MGIKFANNASAQLTGGVIATDTQFLIDAAKDALFPTIATIGADYFYVTLEDANRNLEIVKIVQHVSGSNTLNCDNVGNRGLDGTTAKAFAIGDVIEMRPTKMTMEDLRVAANITSVPSGGLSATNVQAALEELDTEKSDVTHTHADKSDVGHTHSAGAIASTPAGGLSATDVQAALNELDNEKLSIAGNSSSQLTDFANAPGTTTGLTYGYNAGTIRSDNVTVAVAAGTIALAANVTNYVEVSGAGTVSVNSTAFTAGRFPMATVLTGASTITTITDKRGFPVVVATPPQGVATGAIVDFGGTAVPSGYLGCDGANVSRTTYAALFAAISTTWGVGDGSTTFGLPDMRRRAGVGSGGTGTGTLGNAVGNTGGSETHTLSAAEMPSHSHNEVGSNGGNVKADNSGSNNVSLIASQASKNGNAADIMTGAAGSGGSHNNMQPSAVVLKIIKT